MSTEKPPRGFRRFMDKAEELAKDPKATSALLESAVTKARGGGIDRVKAEFLDMMRMLKAYFRGDYRKMPWTTIIMALGGALYFVNPFDLIPDFLIGPGLLDDATVIAFCLRSLRKDLQDYLTWEAGATGSSSAP